MIICKIDEFGYWTEISKEIPETSGAEPGWVIANPPELQDGECAIWMGQWEKTEDKRPMMREQQLAGDIRNQRNQLLAATDWWVVSAAEKGETISAKRATYRQELRDVTNQSNFPYNVIWPIEPGA